MNTRIELDDSVVEKPSAPIEWAAAPAPCARQIAHIDWERSTEDGMKLYLSEEPGIGDEFSYNGVRWRIVDYRDGWVARLLV